MVGKKTNRDGASKIKKKLSMKRKKGNLSRDTALGKLLAGGKESDRCLELIDKKGKVSGGDRSKTGRLGGGLMGA